MSVTNRQYLILVIALSSFFLNIQAQKEDVPGSRFIIDNQVNISTVKDQGPSGTCWSFAAVSFIESELMRMGKGLYDLSEMFLVRTTYMAKADKYVRMHGTINFGSGGEANDVTTAIVSAGIVPESVFPGNDFDMNSFNFEMMDRTLKQYVDDLINSPEDKLNSEWKKGFEDILDRFLGEVPDTFEWQGALYTPLSFAAGLELNMEDYILVGSYTHHPFYEKFILEIPDNWSWAYVYNVPIQDMIHMLDQSLLQGYSVVWATDITEEGFSFAQGLAVNGEEEEMASAEVEGSHDKGMLKPAMEVDLYKSSLTPLVPESISQERRQAAFDNYETQDDHAMHIIGTAMDQKGEKYYYVKNSWGHDNLFKGFMYASESYVRFKTISVMINKNALDQEQLRKLNIY